MPRPRSPIVVFDFALALFVLVVTEVHVFGAATDPATHIYGPRWLTAALPLLWRRHRPLAVTALVAAGIVRLAGRARRPRPAGVRRAGCAGARSSAMRRWPASASACGWRASSTTSSPTTSASSSSRRRAPARRAAPGQRPRPGGHARAGGPAPAGDAGAPVIGVVIADDQELVREGVRMMLEAEDDAEIAAELFLSDAIVKSQVARILGKLGLRDRVQAVIRAYESGVVRPGDAGP